MRFMWQLVEGSNAFSLNMKGRIPIEAIRNGLKIFQGFFMLEKIVSLFRLF